MGRIRGGAWDGASSYLPGFRNLKSYNTLKRPFLGFRVVKDNEYRVLNGGCWTYYPTGSYQQWTYPNASGHGLGFRVARDE